MIQSLCTAHEIQAFYLFVEVSFYTKCGFNLTVQYLTGVWIHGPSCSRKGLTAAFVRPAEATLSVDGP